ncbi:hypothetical protein [Alphaproteobacteria bacterium endosymbiont of Tiliacea citrago]|uniref:hypothetical protein n=1 Tax=Alphaproteobacteria bacterium endosymbiont of Tiliacea citrago TaxID=3077944 RepID=UPI00313E3AEB
MKIRLIFLFFLLKESLQSITLEEVAEQHTEALQAYNLAFHDRRINRNNDTNILRMPPSPEQLPAENRGSDISYLNTTSINLIFDDFLNNVTHNPDNFNKFDLWFNDYFIGIIRASYQNRNPFRQGLLTSTVNEFMQNFLPIINFLPLNIQTLIQNLNIVALAAKALPKNIDHVFDTMVSVTHSVINADFMNSNETIRDEAQRNAVIFLKNTLLTFS